VSAFTVVLLLARSLEKAEVVLSKIEIMENCTTRTLQQTWDLEAAFCQADYMFEVPRMNQQ